MTEKTRKLRFIDENRTKGLQKDWQGYGKSQALFGIVVLMIFLLAPADYGIGMLTLPVGGFLVLAALIAAMQWALARPKKDKEESK